METGQKYLQNIKLVCWWRKVSPVRVLEETSTGQSGHHKSPSVSQIILRPNILLKNPISDILVVETGQFILKHQASVLVA